MTYLAAGVILVGLVGVLNLLLAVGIIRRLRTHTAHLNQLLAPGGPEADGLPVGAAVPAYAATATDGAPVSRDLLAGETLVGFFSADCRACEQALPEFLTVAGGWGSRDRVLAVVSADGSGYAARLAEVARVVVADPAAGLAAAFRVTALPMFYLVDAGGTVRARGYRPRQVTGAQVPA